MKKKMIIGCCLLFTIIVIIIASLMLYSSSEKNYVPYAEFVNKIASKEVKSVQILNKDRISFLLKGDEQVFYTENPDYDSFKEYLLLNQIKIEDSFGKENVNYIFDVMFYLIFFGIAFFGIYKLISFGNKDFKIIHKSNITFDNVVGLDDVKQDMLKAVEVLKNPKEYLEKGIRPTKGIILEGPPGNGKTLFAKALASEAKVNFIPTKGADFQSAMMSVGPRKIKALFRKARRNKPCIIFIDEFDGIGERRNYAGQGVDKENNRIIISMLNEMDGFSGEDGVLVIAATNSYASLDAALVRPGRFDKKYQIGNPNIASIEKLIDMYTQKKMLSTAINVSALAKCFEGLSAAAIETILNEAAMNAEIHSRKEIQLEDIVCAGKKTGTVQIRVK